jgi:uncharacterized protein YdbL (DUF1318 family)
MNKSKGCLKRVPVIALVFSCALLVFSAGEKERMIERVPQISELKAIGVVGERPNGLLGLVKENPAAKAVVDAENEDRKAVYTDIARSSGASVSTVAMRRALQIVEQASPGDWLQNADGSWYQKK